MEPGLTEFRNVNELPQVPKGARRSFVEIGGLWFYEDIFRLNFTSDYTARDPELDKLREELRQARRRYYGDV